MKALVYDLSISRYLASKAVSKLFPKRYFAAIGCLSLTETFVSDLPSDDWAVIKTEACGICGSDLSLLTGKDSFSLEPYSSFPAVLGHEAIGKIVKLGNGITGFSEGDRVAVENILPCETRGIESKCEPCKRGDYSLCENFTAGKLSPGPINGYNSSVGGGFGEYFIAHKSQLFHLPENMPADKAVLVDPAASALQPAFAHLPKNDETVLVYGCGIIGILLINALRALGSKVKIIAVARHKFQAERAKDAGADEIITKKVFKKFAEITGAKILQPSIGKPVFEGGVDLVFDCVGTSDTIDNSMRMLKRRGKLVVVGASGMLKKVDSSPVWFKEITVTGSSMYSNIIMDGQKVRTYKAALDIIHSGAIKTEGLVTHSFPLENYKKAINAAVNKKANKSIKVIFRF